MVVMIVSPPTKWWRRARSIQVAVWPVWLAQWLCNHKATDHSWKPVRCADCGKIFWDYYKTTSHKGKPGKSYTRPDFYAEDSSQ